MDIFPLILMHIMRLLNRKYQTYANVQKGESFTCKLRDVLKKQKIEIRVGDFVELSTFTNSVTGGGASWNIDLSSNTKYYKYYRIVCTGNSYTNAGAVNQCHIAELKITATEQITVKGSATDYDFGTSKAYVLKRKRPKEYRKKVIDTATAGTYTFDVAKDTTARIILVGGGGAGGQVWEGHAEGSGGGSGACVYCAVKLTAGTYTIANGAAGVFAGGNAGNSTLSLGDTTLITAGGGTGGRDSGGAVGVGGTYSFADGVEIEKIVFASNGNNGVVGGNMWGGTGGASVYKGYGAGGNSRTGGNAGYIWVELTTDESDYDYKIDNDACYVLKRKQYWKYEYQDWTQPVLTANGAMGGSNFAVAQSSSYNSNDFWKLFASSPSGWHSAAGLPQWVSWYNPKPLKVIKLNFAEHTGGQIKDFIVQACDDNSSWVDILSYSNTVSKDAFEVDLSSNDKAYKYWRIYITSCYYVYNGAYYPLINDGFTITAQTFEGFVKATKDDYDLLLIKGD